MNKKKKSLILFFALIYVFSALSVNAQLKSDDISLSINPKQPGPNETVSATLASYSVDLNKTLITWSINGQALLQNVGQKTFSFRTGESGIQTILGIKIDTTDGSSINKQLVINPATIDLLWEAVDSYTPPFYKGKALVPSEGAVKVVALLNSNNSNGVVYNWKLDEKSKIDSSGYGKNYYYFQKTYLDRINKIDLGAINILGNSIGSNSIQIGNSNPKILFYKKDPNLGTKWEEALTDGFNIKSTGETIVLEPYFITPKNLNLSNLKISWTLGNSPISTPDIKNELNIKPETTGGSSNIQIDIENINKMFLKINKKINVTF